MLALKDKMRLRLDKEINAKSNFPLYLLQI